MSEHEGQRKRLKDRFRREGLDHFEEVHALELLLFYCMGRKDTAPLARRLLEHFGSFTAVLEASTEELQKVEGVGEHISTYLTLVNQAGRYYQMKRSAPGQILRTVDQCGRYLLPRFQGLKHETVFLLCLDAKCKMLCCRKVGEGSVNSASIPVPRIVEIALNAGASTVVLAHNHPSGLAIPSPEDIVTTKRVAQALETVEVILADHLVVAGDDYVSIVQSQYYTPAQDCAIR